MSVSVCLCRRRHGLSLLCIGRSRAAHPSCTLPERFSAFWDANAGVVARQPAAFPLRLLVLPGGSLLQPVVAMDGESPTLRQAVQGALGRQQAGSALLHGVPAPLHAPCADLARSAAYADNFVYVVVGEEEQEGQEG